MEICIQFFKNDATTFTLSSLPCDLGGSILLGSWKKPRWTSSTGCGGESGWDAFFTLSEPDYDDEASAPTPPDLNFTGVPAGLIII